VTSINSIQRFYWRVFNVVVRVVSGGLALGSAGLIAGAVIDTDADKPLLIILGLAVGVPAIFMLRAKAFRPDIDGYASALHASPADSRSWWTGDAKGSEE
jgi:hypothetical protein